MTLLCAVLSGQAAFAQQPKEGVPPAVPGHFIDVTDKSCITFKAVASHTSKKYLLETMASGVALFDYDNDGRLDIFFPNGAPLQDPTRRGTIPAKVSPADWNGLYHQKPDGTFQCVIAKAGLADAGYSLGVAVGDYDNRTYQQPRRHRSRGQMHDSLRFPVGDGLNRGQPSLRQRQAPALWPW